LLKTVKGFCCLMQEIKNGIDRTHLKLKNIYLSMCILVFILLIYIVSHYAQNSNIYYLYRIIVSTQIRAQK